MEWVSKSIFWHVQGAFKSYYEGLSSNLPRVIGGCTFSEIYQRLHRGNYCRSYKENQYSVHLHVFFYMLLEEFVHTFILIEVILNIREYKKKLEKVCEVMKIESI